MLNPAGKENKGDTVSDFVRRTNNEPRHCKGAPRRGHGSRVLRLERGGHEMTVAVESRGHSREGTGDASR